VLTNNFKILDSKQQQQQQQQQQQPLFLNVSLDGGKSGSKLTNGRTLTPNRSGKKTERGQKLTSDQWRLIPYTAGHKGIGWLSRLNGNGVLGGKRAPLHQIGSLGALSASPVPPEVFLSFWSGYSRQPLLTLNFFVALIHICPLSSGNCTFIYVFTSYPQ